jgi:long-chain acyl-CoA synthetase
VPTIISHLKKNVERAPEAGALVFGDKKIEYGLFLESIRRLAQGLKNIGISVKDRVAIMLPNVPHFCISYYGVLELGAIAVPVNIMYDEENIAYILNDSGAKAIIAWVGFKSQVSAAVAKSPECKQVIYLGDTVPKGTLALSILLAQSRPLEETVDIPDSDSAVINYTSGVSDMPHGAELSHDALFSNATTCREMFMITAQEKLLAILPLFHPLGQTLVMNTAVLAGACVVILPRFSPEEIYNVIKQNGVTFMAGVPGMFKSLAELAIEKGSTPSLKYCMSYGSPLPDQVLKDFEEKFDTLILEAYGLTEAGPLVTANRLHRDRKHGSAGLPLVGVELQIRDASNDQLRPKQNGEIWIKSPGLMKGYYNKPAETEAILKDGWLFTRDIGYLDEDHYLFIQERKDDIIEKSGFHIFPSEIESLLMQHPAVAEVAVVGVAGLPQGAEIKAFIVLKKGAEMTKEQVETFCIEAQLPLYKIPKIIEFCPELPKSPTGRVLKRLLRKKGENKSPNSAQGEGSGAFKG